MIEPIKPVEGSIKASEGQSSALAEVVRARYWKQLAQKMPPVESSEESSQPKGKPNGQVEAKVLPPTIHSTFAEFEINRDTAEVLVRIFDADSGDLVRTIPPDQLAKEIVEGKLFPNQLRRKAVFV